MLLQAVSFPILRYSCFAHTHLVGNYAPVALRKRRDKVAIQVAPGRIAMNHHHWLPTSFIYIVHVESLGRGVVRGKGERAFKGLISDSEHRTSPKICDSLNSIVLNCSTESSVYTL